MIRRVSFVLAIVIGLLSFSKPAAAQEPGWLGVVIAEGELERQIENTDILQRPYRPFHFYGNTVRRMYYRGSPLPRLYDFADGVRALRRARN